MKSTPGPALTELTIDKSASLLPSQADKKDAEKEQGWWKTNKHVRTSGRSGCR